MFSGNPKIYVVHKAPFILRYFLWQGSPACKADEPFFVLHRKIRFFKFEFSKSKSFHDLLIGVSRINHPFSFKIIHIPFIIVLNDVKAILCGFDPEKDRQPVFRKTSHFNRINLPAFHMVCFQKILQYAFCHQCR